LRDLERSDVAQEARPEDPDHFSLAPPTRGLDRPAFDDGGRVQVEKPDQP
jgi:hypothetical protein